MPLRPNPLCPSPLFKLSAALTGITLITGCGVAGKSGPPQAKNAAVPAPSPVINPAAGYSAALTPPPFIAPGIGATPTPPSLASSLIPKGAIAAPPGGKLPPDKRAQAKSFFDTATAALQKRDIKSAETNFQKVLGIDPNHLATLLYLSQIYLGENQPLQALPQLQKATQVAPGNPAAQFELARTLVNVRRPLDAITPLRKAVQLAPKEHASRELLAQIYLAQKKPADAYAQWTALAQLQPQDVDAHLQAAGLAAEVLKKPAEAEKWLRLASQGAPRDPRAGLMLGRLLLAERKPKAAVQALKQTAKARPEIFEIYPILAEAYGESGDLNNAKGALQSALMRVPVGKTAAEKQRSGQIEGGLHFSLGRILGQAKQPKAALTEFRRAAALAPNDPSIPSLMALAYEQTGDRKGAIAAAQQALKLDPKQATNHLLLAQLQAQTGNWSATNQAYQSYIALQPRDGAALTEWAFAAKRAKKTEDELKIWAKLSALDPKNRTPWMQSGDVLRDTDHPSEALSKYQHALSLNERDADALFQIAQLQSLLKKSGDATATWKKLIAVRPSYLPAYAALLGSSAKSGDESSTRMFLAKRLAADSNPKALDEVLRYYEFNKNQAGAKALLSDVVKRSPNFTAAKTTLDALNTPPTPQPEVKPEVKPTVVPTAAP